MLLSTLLGSFLAAPTPLNDWKPCSTDPKDTLLCATLQVPLDYKTQKTIGVALIKYPAPKQPAKGSVLFNPGGPGGSGVSFIKYGGNSTSRVYFDDSMDLIGFDPRGVGKTIPLMCYNSTEELLAGALINRKYKFSATMTAAEHALAVKESELFAENCAAYSGGEYLNYLSTYYVAKDMDEIRKFVGSEMMNFVGFSYGTCR
jgi:pimeloyl-ACP methyl ester carboxylesterase